MNDKMKNINEKLDNTAKSAGKTVKAALATLKEEIGDEIDALADKIKSIEAKQQSNSTTVPSVEDDNEIKRRFIIRNLAERDNENINSVWTILYTMEWVQKLLWKRPFERSTEQIQTQEL